MSIFHDRGLTQDRVNFTVVDLSTMHTMFPCLSLLFISFNHFFIALVDIALTLLGASNPKHPPSFSPTGARSIFILIERRRRRKPSRRRRAGGNHFQSRNLQWCTIYTVVREHALHTGKIRKEGPVYVHESETAHEKESESRGSEHQPAENEIL